MTAKEMATPVYLRINPGSTFEGRVWSGHRQLSERFTSRRGVPNEMVSDCRTNFVGAVRELKELVNQMDQDIIQQKTAYQGVRWNFNPPHFGDVHEAMIKSAKKAMNAVLGNSVITDEELTTAVTWVEGLLNSRPLMYQFTSYAKSFATWAAGRPICT